MFHTLYAKLSLALFLLFLLVGGAFFISSMYSAYMYQQEVVQRLNKDLAMYIVDEHVHIDDGKVDDDSLKALFHTVMVINPSLELYLLNNDGAVMSYSSELEKVERKKVSLLPIQAMMDGEQNMPILGDDPKSLDTSKAFSVSPIISQGKQYGYIYAVLGSEQVDYISQLFQKSYILRVGVGAHCIGINFCVYWWFGYFLFTHAPFESFKRDNGSL